MREIKFRAWDKDEEWMVYNVQDAYDGLPYSKENAEHIVDSYDWVSGFSSFLGSDDFIPMQYTGLKDKNGVEIYEGDIVHLPQHNHSGRVFLNVNHGWVVEGICMSVKVHNYKNIEVIGNIYDNPELMENKK